ncbi:MAG: glycosyltransferase family 4 protein, partial [Gammaproteobacteria bacterium]|nr:glycosyltransferase family 4 protein [Gammaproteobacteria bacterium]
KSIQQVHVFTSYVEGLNGQNVGSVYVHRSSKHLVSALPHSNNAFEKRISNFNSNSNSNSNSNLNLNANLNLKLNPNFNMTMIMGKYISSEKHNQLHSHGELSRMTAKQVQKTNHPQMMITTQSVGINRLRSDRTDIVIGQDVVGEMDIPTSIPTPISTPMPISRSIRGELNKSFGMERLNQQKVRDAHTHLPSKFVVPVSNYFNKNFEWTTTNISIAGMVEKYISIDKLDLLHSHGGLIQMAAAKVQKTTHLPLVMTAHSLEINRPRPDNFSILMEQNVVDRVDRFIAVSESIRKELNQTFGIGNSKISVIPNGVDTTVFKHQDADDTRRKYQLDDRFVVLFVGRDDPQKGVEYLVKAVKKLAVQIPQIMLVIVGQQDTYFDKHILSIPRVSKSELVKLYSLSDVFVLPSIYEPFGIVLLEAMACETPCIGSRVGGIPDIIDHDKTGLLVEPESDEELSDAIAKLYYDSDKRYSMGKNGRERAISCFDWNDVSSKTIRVYQQVLH